MTLYKGYAEEIANLIHSGVLKPGERLPSLREASRRRGISISTVLKAYHLLEARGLITARERSCFSVTKRLPRFPDTPASSKPPLKSTAVSKSDLIFEILQASRSPDIVPLGSAFPSARLFPLQRLSRSLNRAMRHLDPKRTVTDLSPGNAELRRQIALRYHLDGLNIDPDELVITDGAMEALNLCLQAVTRPGDTVVIESPTFYVALQALERLGLRAIEVATHPRDGIDLDTLENVLHSQQPAACWLMTSFQNPLGALMPPDKKKKLVALLNQYNIPLIEDDVYGELYYGEARPRPAKAYDNNDQVLHCSSFSKCLAPGYRIGWAAPGRYSQKVQQLKLGTSLAAALPSQLALSDYLDGTAYDQHLRKLRETLYAGRDDMIEQIQTHFPAGTRVTRPEGGYFLWLELPRGSDSLALHRLALAQGISIAPGPIFSARDNFRHCIRLNYGHPEDARVPAAIATLADLAKRCPTQAA